MDINLVILAGRLTRDPEVKHTPGGTVVAEFGLAITSHWKDKAGERKESTTFVDVGVFGRSAELVGEHLQKGASAVVEGRLQLDTWSDRTTGQKRTKLRVIAERVHFGDRHSSGRFDRRSAPANESEGRPAAPDPQAVGAGVPSDDVPFMSY